MGRYKTPPRDDSLQGVGVHSYGMQQLPQLTVVGRSTVGLPRTYRVQRPKAATSSFEAARNAAYRRLTGAILGVDVASLTHGLRAARLRRSEFSAAA